MNITRETIKSTLRNIMAEESEYQTFFKKALEKAGKSIPSMSDEEKKEFFNKIDAAWNAKGEKNEGNAFGAAVVAAKEKGEDEFEVGGKTYKVESVNEDTKKRFDVDFYKSMGDRQTSHEEIIRGDKFSDVVEAAQKILKAKKYEYAEFYYKDKFLGSIHKSIHKFKPGRDYKSSPISVFESVNESASCSCGCGTCSEAINEAASDRDFEKVFNLFNKKDYFHLKGSIKTMLGNWQRALDRGDKGAQQYTKQDVIDSVTAQTKARAKHTYDELVKAINKKDINALKSKLRHDQKFSLAIFTQVTGKKLPKSTRDIHSFIDNEFMGESIVKEDENPCWKGYKQIGMKDKNGREVPNCVPESVQSVNEGRAFINAARKAKEEGKTEFEFNGKTYPVTLKEEAINERRLGKVDLLKTVEKGDSSYVEGVKISPALAFELRMFLQRPMLARTRTGIAIDNAQMKDALGMLAKVGVQKRLTSGVRKEFDNLLNKYNK